jgi:hypothetical protein
MQQAKNVDKTGRATFKKLECPFDLDAIFSMQFSTSGLKSVLEFLFEHMGTVEENYAA